MSASLEPYLTLRVQLPKQYAIQAQSFYMGTHLGPKYLRVEYLGVNRCAPKMDVYRIG